MKYCKECYKNEGWDKCKYRSNIHKCPRCGSKLTYLDINRRIYINNPK